MSPVSYDELLREALFPWTERSNDATGVARPGSHTSVVEGAAERLTLRLGA